MFICTELIDETGTAPGHSLGLWDIFWPCSEKFESWENIRTFDRVMT